MILPPRKQMTTTRHILARCWRMTRERMIEVMGYDPGEEMPPRQHDIEEAGLDYETLKARIEARMTTKRIAITGSDTAVCPFCGYEIEYNLISGGSSAAYAGFHSDAPLEYYEEVGKNHCEHYYEVDGGMAVFKGDKGEIQAEG